MRLINNKTAVINSVDMMCVCHESSHSWLIHVVAFSPPKHKASLVRVSQIIMTLCNTRRSGLRPTRHCAYESG